MPEPARLYILMRTDMDNSMSPGRKMAQASHAANVAQNDLTQEFNGAHPLFLDWRQEACGFGTAIVLGAKLNDLELVRQFKLIRDRNEEFDCGIVHDPVYMIADGEVAHEIAVDTCAWVFGSPDNIHVQVMTSHLGLHP